MGCETIETDINSPTPGTSSANVEINNKKGRGRKRESAKTGRRKGRRAEGVKEGKLKHIKRLLIDILRKKSEGGFKWMGNECVGDTNSGHWNQIVDCKLLIEYS